MSTNTKDMPIVKLESPRFKDSAPLLIAGLAGRHTGTTLDDLPALWKRFSVYIGRIPGQVEVGDISSSRTRVETSLYGKYDLVSVVSGIGLQNRSLDRRCSRFL